MRQTNVCLGGQLQMTCDIACITGFDGRFKGFDAAWLERFGYDEAELLGTLFLDLVHPEDRKGAAAQIEQLTTNSDVAGFETRYRCKDGSYRWLVWRAEPDSEHSIVRASAREISGFKSFEISLHRTLEELEAHRRSLADASKRKSDLLAAVSHELRTPLNSIIGFTNLMQSGQLGRVSKQHRELLGDILSGAQHLLHVTEELLDLGQFETGKAKFHPEGVDLVQLAKEVSRVLGAMASPKGISIDIDIPGEVRNVLVDPVKLRQVLYNYLSNAVKFTPQGGRVRVVARAEGPSAFRVEVEDTGIGIAPQETGKLFQEFQQLGPRDRSSGAGLGLALTKRIVEAQSGRVGVQSTPGRGSRFFAVLPRDASKLEAPRLGTRTAQAEGVLLVSSNAAGRRPLEDAIRKAGLAVEVAASGKEGLAACSESQFHTIALDTNLSDFSAWELFAAIRARGPNKKTPVNFVTLISELGLAGGVRIDDIVWQPLEVMRFVSCLASAGLKPQNDHRVLVVDTDTEALSLLEATLKSNGYRPLFCGSADEALNCVRREAPGAVIANLTHPGLNGFQFVEQLRSVETGADIPGLPDIPIIATLSRDFGLEECLLLEWQAQNALLQRRTGINQIVNALLISFPGKAEDFPAQRAG
jgi:PAS domain S-box-containing protein